MYKITEYLATHGLGESSYPMERIKTGEVLEDTGFAIVDVRLMLDEPQPLEVYKNTIAIAMVALNRRGKIVICCGAGQSRSNAIALAVLMIKENMDFYDAWEKVKERVPICMIESCHISAIKKLFGVTLP